MAWQMLGTVNLSYDWQFLAVPSGNYQLFRITQLYSDTDYIHGKIVIGQVFDEPKQFYNYKAIFPSKNQKLIKLLAPLELLQGSIHPDRYLAFKFDSRYYRYSISWLIQIELEDIIPAHLNEIKVLTNLNRQELAIIQTQLDRIEARINDASTTAGTSSTQFDDPDSSASLGAI